MIVPVPPALSFQGVAELLHVHLIPTLDESWNSQEWITIDKRHAVHIDVFWPGQANPTHGRSSHKEKAIVPLSYIA